MVEVILEGYRYRYCKTNEGGYWLGVAGYKGSLGRYNNCRVPTMLWCGLRAKALSEGYTTEDFSLPKKEAKEKKVRSKAKKKNSISIF